MWGERERQRGLRYELWHTLPLNYFFLSSRSKERVIIIHVPRENGRCACAYINSSLVYRPAEIIDKFLRFMEEASDDREGDNENFLSFLNRLKNLWSVGSWDLKNPNWFLKIPINCMWVLSHPKFLEKLIPCTWVVFWKKPSFLEWFHTIYTIL